jgi:hypothetical protein
VIQYPIVCRLVTGGYEALHIGVYGLHEFIFTVEAGDEAEALEKAYEVIDEWINEHNFVLSSPQFIFNHAEKFEGAKPFTLASFIEETGGDLNERERNRRFDLRWGTPEDTSPTR